ncbi:MAG: RDD family protein [Thiomargarita sp.]|nr:RDD family protein [Thiomargarita sp.]
METSLQSEQICTNLFRHFAAIFYDSLLLFSVLFFAAAIIYPLIHEGLIFQLYLLTIWFLYFAWAWKRGGQTLGMKAWRIKLQSTQGEKISWQQTLIRFLVAILSILVFGLGFFWAIISGKKQTWHDRASNTCIVLIAKK